MKDILSYLTSPVFSGNLLILKILFIFFALILGGGIIYFLIKSQYLKVAFMEDLIDFFTYRPFRISKIAKQWAEITKRLETESEAEAKLAVIEADRILDDILKKMGYQGETLGERLKLITPVALPNITQVFKAHKIRNNIVHDPDYRLSLEEAKRAIAIYEKALTDLQTL